MTKHQPTPELAEAQRRYRLLRAAVSDYHYHVRVEGGRIVEKFHEANCELITGYKSEEYAADPSRWIAIVWEEDRPVIERQTSEVLAEQPAPAIEYRIRRKDGQPLWIRKTVVPYHDAYGRLIAYDSLLRDITDSKLAAESLRESEEHLEAIWNSAFDAIITIDIQGMIETANWAAEKMFGYAKSEIIGQNVKLLMPSPYREEHDGYLRRYRETGQARILNMPRELVARRKDGTTFPIDLSVTPVDHSDYFTGVIRDISERKQLQEHVLESAAEEQRRIGLELHDGTGQELTGLSLVAGTLFNLVNAVPVKESNGERVRQFDQASFTRLYEIAKRLNEKIAEANRLVYQLSHGIMPVQIDSEALRSALDELAASIHDPPKISCSFDCPLPVMAPNNTTATHLYRIAQEAVNNALKHSQAKEIRISLRQNDDQIALEVSDNGVGIEAAGSRVDITRKDRGMGLRTMQYRAGMIAGTLQIQRRETGGTLVRCVSLCKRGGKL